MREGERRENRREGEEEGRIGEKEKRKVRTGLKDQNDARGESW